MTATGPQPTASYAGYNRKFLSAAIGAVSGPRGQIANLPLKHLRIFGGNLTLTVDDGLVRRLFFQLQLPQPGMVDEVRERIERANEHAYQNQKLLRFYYGRVKPEKKVWKTSVSG